MRVGKLLVVATCVFLGAAVYAQGNGDRERDNGRNSALDLGRLFTVDAADLSRFCRMLLDGGRLGSVRILSPATVARMTAPSTPAGMRDVRGLGWDIDSSYSANRGELFPIGSFGHTGFTGTSLWLDPGSKSYVIFLSNRVHPDGKGDVTPPNTFWPAASVMMSSMKLVPPTVYGLPGSVASNSQ